jgi:DNA-binding PadR family transcriptional regulator
MPPKTPATGLTELEGTVLAAVERLGPISAYRVRTLFERSPTGAAALSQGSVYPIVERLKARGLVAAFAVPGDRRNTEQLRVTPAGLEVVRAWVVDLPPNAAVPLDPLRVRILSLGTLSDAERRRWLEDARAALLGGLATIEAYAREHADPLMALANDNARSTLLARLGWLDRVGEELG